GVVCISVNGCMDDGKFTSIAAQKIFDAAKTTYVEKSSDGKDMHVFGRMADIKTEHLSKDGSMELFAASDFLPVTGDAMTDAKILSGFTEGSVMRGIIESSFEERKSIGALTEKDEKILEAAKNHPETGDIFTRLFSGENVKGTEEQSDESLMMRLSCRTRGDTDAMKRLYNASGRKNKDPEHIDHLAVRSKKNTADFLEETKARETRERAESRRADYSNSNYNAGYKY
ncbi:MAG: hypothetical protein LUD72_12775, partial [Bacteroidales bacterium]|nr:hypothetical protein [Bacteroidales bacterium]